MDFIAYYRVSTKLQGVSGLGLDSQKQTVEKYIDTKNGKLIASFKDIESGKKDNRPFLLKAIEYAKKNNCTLVIAKLDRLSRNLTFISSLMDSKVKFVCCDMPEANEFTIHIFGSLAQMERKLISERTKNALNELKKRGVKLGKVENLNGSKLGVEKIKQKAKSNVNNMQSKSKVLDLLQLNYTFTQIMENLNKNGFKTSTGKQFTNIIQVKRLAK